MADRQPRFAALQIRDFRLVWAGLGISWTGTQIQRVAVAWQMYELTHSPVSLGLIGLFRAIPILGLGLFSGAVADAVDRRRLMLVTQSLLALSSTVLAVLTFTGHITPAAIYAMTFLSGAAQAFDSPARQSIVPAIVPRQILANALSLSATTAELASVVGPGIGGLIVEGGGIGAAYVCDALSFFAVIVALLLMTHRHIPPKESRVNVAAVIEGLRFVKSQPLIVWLMSLDFVGTFFAGATQLMPIFADSILHVGKSGL
jgi:Transmembrane secretion effector